MPSELRGTHMKVNAICYAIMIRMLMERPCTIQEVIDETGLGMRSVCNTLRVWKRHGILYRAALAQDSVGRWNIPLYRLGKGKDCPPRRMSREEKNEKDRLRYAQERERSPSAEAIAAANPFGRVCR